MEEIVATNETDSSLWHIDLDWVEQNCRSLFPLVRQRLCSRCQRRMSKGEHSFEDYMKAIQGCCSEQEDYISVQLPLMECVFRLLLANGNETMNLDDLSRQLGERRGGDSGRTSKAVLKRLIGSDTYYGIRQDLP